MASPRRHGRPPALTARGKTWAFGAALLTFAGGAIGSWPVAGLGLMATSLLCALYLGFYPTSVLIWRKHLELKWHLERQADAPGGGFVVGRPFKLRITLRNRAPRALGRARVRVFSSSTLDGPGELVIELGARREASTGADMTAISPNVVAALKPMRIGTQVVGRPGGGRVMGDAYDVRIRFGGHALPGRWFNLEAVEAPPATAGVDVLIDMELPLQIDMTWFGPRRLLLLSS